MKKWEEYKRLPSWVYLVYGIIIILLSAGLFVGEPVPSLNGLFGNMPFLQTVLYFIVGIIYLLLGLFKKKNTYTDVSVKIGFVPFILFSSLTIVEDIQENTLPVGDIFNSRLTWVVYIASLIIAYVSFIVLLIGLFKKKE